MSYLSKDDVLWTSGQPTGTLISTDLTFDGNGCAILPRWCKAAELDPIAGTDGYLAVHCVEDATDPMKIYLMPLLTAALGRNSAVFDRIWSTGNQGTTVDTTKVTLFPTPQPMPIS